MNLTKSQKLLEAGYYPEAEAALGSPDAVSDPRAELIRARIQSEVGKNESALSILAGAVERWPDYAPALLLHSIQAADMDELKVARQSLDRALELQPGNDVAHSYSAFVSLRLGDMDSGVSTFVKHGFSDNRMFRVRLTEWMESEWIISGRFFGQRDFSPPDASAKASNKKALKHFYARDYQQMMMRLPDAESANEMDSFLGILGSEMLWDYSRAERFLSRIKTSPETWPGVLIAARARILIRTGKLAEGAAELNRILIAGPEDYGANYYLGVLCLAHGNRKQARELFFRAYTSYLIDTLDFQWWQIERALK